MKLPVWRNPKLFALLVILFIMLFSVPIAQGETPLEYPAGLVALIAGLLAGAVVMLSARLEEQLGGEPYLRHLLTVPKPQGQRPYWFVGMLALAVFIIVRLLVQQSSEHAATWYWYGGLWSMLIVGYPLVRAQWTRLESMMAAERAQAASA